MHAGKKFGAHKINNSQSKLEYSHFNKKNRNIVYPAHFPAFVVLYRAVSLNNEVKLLIFHAHCPRESAREKKGYNIELCGNLVIKFLMFTLMVPNSLISEFMDEKTQPPELAAKKHRFFCSPL